SRGRFYHRVDQFYLTTVGHFYFTIYKKDAAIGYRIGEIRTTPYLLAAIYYDLWELITDNRPIITCGNCGLPIEKSGRRDYCNDACKQAAYRKRRKEES
ncbi:MAG: hypothetical protein K6U74_15825, partial [Firmicutes bacterium]|nr:hypothetical protein [Bacillota bacterium]